MPGECFAAKTSRRVEWIEARWRVALVRSPKVYVLAIIVRLLFTFSLVFTILGIFSTATSDKLRQQAEPTGESTNPLESIPDAVREPLLLSLFYLCRLICF